MATHELDASSCLLELWSRDDVSESVDLTRSGNSDGSGGTDDNLYGLKEDLLKYMAVIPCTS